MRMVGPIHVKPTSTRIHARARAGLALLAAVLLASALASPTFARQGGLAQRISCALAAQDSFAPADQRLIKEVAAAAAARLRDADPANSARGREDLIAPLACPGVTVAFRAEYGRALDPELAPLARDQDVRLAVNALLVMGKVKASQTVPTLRAGLSDRRPAVRLAAAAGFKDFISPPNSGLPERIVDGAISDVAAALSSESDPNVADVLVAALDAARASDLQRAQATARMVAALAERVQSVRATDSEGAWAPTILRGVVASRDTLIYVLGAGIQDPELARNIARLAAFALGYLAERVERRQVTDQSPLDEALHQIAAAVDASVVVAHSAAGGSPLRSAGLREAYNRAIEGGDATELRSRLNAWIGPTGLFTQPPHNIPAAELLSR